VTRAARVRRSPRPRTARTRNAGNKYPAIESPASAGLFFCSACRLLRDLDRRQAAEAESLCCRRREIDDAAAHERPRSLIRTVTLRPLRLLVTFTFVPNGSVRCAA